MDRTKLRAQASPRRLEALIETTVAYMDRLAVQMRPTEHRMTSGMVYGQQIKYVRWEFSPRKFDQIELLQMTDMQFGHVDCKYERVIEYRDWVLAEPNRFMLWTGDNTDAWAMWSPGRPFDQIADPQGQVFKFCETWAPARHRILGYVGGNHERRAIPGFGDLGLLIATLLKIPYSNGRQMIDVAYGKHDPFTIALWHGTGGARTKGAVAQVLDRFLGRENAQLCLMGHLHQPMILPAWREVRDHARQRLVLQKRFGAISSSFLETWNTYGEIAGFSAHDVLMARAVLDPDGHWEVTLR